MIDHKERQLYKAMRENRELLVSDVTKEQAQELARTGKIPAKSVWLWAVQAVYGPKRQESGDRREAAE
jgi:hypothetical protein